ncbi:MAG: hypothetical protein JSW20_10750 [Nitrospiraceae bacterium]|nr:MAG: hypothetical protein JSW20_10750 [Nitrospiraceae bacterium]
MRLMLNASDIKKAPDAEVTMSDGTSHALSDFWRDRHLLLVFLRHFG